MDTSQTTSCSLYRPRKRQYQSTVDVSQIIHPVPNIGHVSTVLSPRPKPHILFTAICYINTIPSVSTSVVNWGHVPNRTPCLLSWLHNPHHRSWSSDPLVLSLSRVHAESSAPQQSVHIQDGRRVIISEQVIQVQGEMTGSTNGADWDMLRL